MNRQSFLQALGLIGVSAVIPVDLIESITPAPLVEEILPAVAKPFLFRLYDIVIFEDGSQALITRMLDNKVELRPVNANQDLGSGCGMGKEYDKDTIPNLVGYLSSAVSEGSRS